MKVVLVSNYLNPHMIPLCTAFNSNPQVQEFKFIALTQQSKMRADMGFSNDNLKHSYVFRAYLNDEAFKKALQITENADVAIVGEAADEFIHVRMKNNKLTYLSSERFYRLGLWRRFIPSSYRKKKNRFLQYKDRKMYFLTIGAYLPYELQLLRFPIQKCFQWAYFPYVYEFQNKMKMSEERHIKILWVGRMIRIKHPEEAIKVAVKLEESGVDFTLKMIGEGPILPIIKEKIKEKNMFDHIRLLGNCSPESVQKQMAESDVFLFTSDYFEGWGAVLNEAMAQGCIPVASYKAGASEVLIENGNNGYIYHKIAQAVKAISEIYVDAESRKMVSARAKDTIEVRWNAQTAVNRFIRVTNNLLAEEDVLRYAKDGPMGEITVRKAKNYITTSY